MTGCYKLVVLLFSIVCHTVSGQSCSVGDSQYNSGALEVTEYGLFLNLADPITCIAGSISSFDYAWYQKQGFVNKPFSFEISIWRQQTGDVYERVSHSLCHIISLLISVRYQIQ